MNLIFSSDVQSQGTPVLMNLVIMGSVQLMVPYEGNVYALQGTLEIPVN